ncbi:hypothetical protein C2845_PM05G05300 [Panicum miliaceum]|uniref:Uncharacterized protein n=1 Tax=Panicum miliaceum TaxID=4540 RepID=A0A3L6SXS6_PANMI|nr:hypothetical protein C2845_PM05G05300 [Panicum miliaceum]
MRALRRVLDGRAAPVAAFEIDFKYMGLYEDWFFGVFRELCGSGGTPTPSTPSATTCPPLCTPPRRSPRYISSTGGSGCPAESPACALFGRSGFTE